MADGGATIKDAKEIGAINPLVTATFGGSVKAMTTCIENGAKVDEKDSGGWTALHYAAAQGQMAAALFLLSQGADPLAKTNEGQTPRAIAFKNGKVDVMMVLEQAEKDGQVILQKDLPDHVKDLRQQVADLTEKFNQLAARLPAEPVSTESKPAAPAKKTSSLIITG